MADDEFAAFFDRDFDRLVGFFCKSGFDREIARDAAAETMTELLRQWSEVTAPKAWVRTVGSRIASRLVMEGPRSVQAAIVGCRSTTDRADDQPHAVVEEQDVVAELLRQLPDVQRVVMAWRLDGFDPAEIAAITESSPTTVRSNLRHARERMKQLRDAQEAEQTPDTTTPRRRTQ
ncbi:RNA polymerase sigma factor [Amycolatopsis sp. cg9]|uniref:RNA polymerase sigma factor n=1 Tax=Amycolatopsis sp. cg9 TaxID=3238801 RepID=UPI00352412ED